MFDIDELERRLRQAEMHLMTMRASSETGTFGYHLFSKVEGVRLALGYIDDMKRSELGVDEIERLNAQIVQLEAEAEAQAAQMARACRELADLSRAAKDQSEISWSHGYDAGNDDGYERGYEDALRKMAAE